MKQARKADICALAILFAAAALILLVFSPSSPLYILETWVDPNCFMTVARGMRAGLVPYRDLMEQKGPLLYAIHLLAVLISPNNFHGVYPIEVLLHTAFLFAAYKTARLFAKRGVVLALIASYVVLHNSYATGDSAEMLSLPLLAWSLYDAVRYFADDERKMSGWNLLRNGFLAGCVLWIKYSLLGLHFAWMAVIAIEAVIRERKVGNAVRMCLVFLAGMVLSSVPWLIYFGVNGAIGDLVDVYFVQNIMGYPNDKSFVYNLIHGFGNDAYYNLRLALLVFIGGVFAVFGTDRKQIWLKICVAAMAACMTVLLYMGGRFRGYTFHVYAVFIPMSAAAICTWIKNKKILVRIAGIAAALLLLYTSADGVYDSRHMLSRRNWSKDTMVQYVFAEEINKTENPTLLNCGALDGGFYLAADIIPTERWFCKLNVGHQECYEAQYSAIKEGRVDYVVTRHKTLEELNMDPELYEMIMEYKKFYLYRLKNLAK